MAQAVAGLSQVSTGPGSPFMCDFPVCPLPLLCQCSCCAPRAMLSHNGSLDLPPIDVFVHGIITAFKQQFLCCVR